MLVLFETAAGYAIFKLMDEGKLQKVDELYKQFETADLAGKLVKLKHFSKFSDMTEALAAATAAVEGKVSKGLKKVLKKVFAADLQEQLAVADAKLGSAIKEKLNISCIHTSAITELFRGLRAQMSSLISGLPESEMNIMALGLSHSLSRYKLKFSPDKVDTMIVQAISLLDDLDKELNNYNMRCREWYGWHFPELGKMIADNLTFARTVKAIGMRVNIDEADLSTVLTEEVEEEVRAAAEISMGTEISQEDIDNILYLCDQVIQIADYRAQLYEYLKNRMMAIAPNLTTMVGELVGARLIAHAGSLLNLAKHPSSTVQILGAEKALFRALKTKHDTPKYGLIYHASLVGQSAPKNKGRISRMLAAKTSLCVRVDALGEDDNTSIGVTSRAMVEERLRVCEQGQLRRISGTGKAKAQAEKYEMQSTPKQYNVAADFTFSGKKRKREQEEEEEDKGEEDKKATKKKKRMKEEVAAKKEEEEEEEVVVKNEEEEGEEPVAKKQKKKSKKRKSKGGEEGEGLDTSVAGGDESVMDISIKTDPEDPETPKSEKKKKKKKKVKPESD